MIVLVRASDADFSESTDKPAIYNLGGGPEVRTSLLEVLDRLDGKSDTRPAVSFKDWREGDQKVYVSGIGRARQELDWETQVDVDEGIGRSLGWHEAAGVW